ncbi:Gfo/Idh/MocA family protein [Virgibacillus salexigens]|uniref:Putative oxidoreductase YcjS n=1 Tax=Virgibacillus massiliensis TaxID=1462526 RepID=A0A024Q7P0_9BACI|nr:Gfo/Idh/MocA family oxidoreductase [Virgibacillus massiliensis]CDQ38469.1 putative oxidoreductase YcjS [Virgibacillus massiliensis]
MASLRVAIIGCGSIAKHRHLLEYQANSKVDIVAVCDKVEERVNETARRYQVKAYTDYQAMLAKEELDAVSVCLPNYLHAPVSIAALETGCHVLCEKPMATSIQEAEAMITATKKRGKKLMIGHNQRFVPSHQKAREMIANGELGKIYSFRTAFGHGGPEGWSIDGKNSWFFKKDEAFIGSMGDLGVHKADLIRFLLGEEISEVAAFVESNAKTDTDVDDNAVCMLKTESGIIGTLAASWAYVSKEDNATRIYGEKGILRLEDDSTYSFIVHHADGNVTNIDLGGIQSNEEDGQTTTHVIDHFVDSILNDIEPLVNGEEGLKSLQVILAALESSQTKTITKI